MSKSPKDKPRYRKGVGAVLFNAEGKVLVARRNDTDGEAWQLPQGGIDAGEDPRRAVLRELAEEIGTDRYEIIGQTDDWLRYDLPADVVGTVWKGRYRGQEQKWFALRFLGEDRDIDLDASGHPEFDAWKWVGLDSLPEMIVAFKRGVYEELVTRFRHLAGTPGGGRG